MGRDGVWSAAMFQGWKQRHRKPQHDGDDGMLWRVYDQGFRARLQALPRRPPAGYEGMIEPDLVGTWIEGWEAAGRELAVDEPSSRPAA